MTRVFVLNSGSSSLKYQVIDVEGDDVVRSGVVERIGEPGRPADHGVAIEGVLGEVEGLGLDAVGHRVVHGGSRFATAVLVDDDVERAIEELSVLAPLHNPANLLGIRAARAALPDLPHVAVFDTAFHQTLPAAAYTVAIDRDLARRYGVRRYGFHGTSYRFVSGRAAELLDRPLESLRMIVLHLGNGASAAAIDHGRSIETSMGMTPLQGLVMGTRAGDLDPSALFHLHREAGLGFEELEDMLNRRSGLLGMSGSTDIRDVQRAESEGDEDAALALAVYRHRVRHYIGAYSAQLGGLDALVFTGGVGEHNVQFRRRVLAGLEFLGIAVDNERNERAGADALVISPEGAPVAVLVVPTNEELEIARQTRELLHA